VAGVAKTAKIRAPVAKDTFRIHDRTIGCPIYTINISRGIGFVKPGFGVCRISE
jgi:hypothetical protein